MILFISLHHAIRLRGEKVAGEKWQLSCQGGRLIEYRVGRRVKLAVIIDNLLSATDAC